MRLTPVEVVVGADVTKDMRDQALAAARALVLHEFTIPGEVATTVHRGATGDEFAAAFGVGNDADQIAEIDAVGVLMMCVQSLLERIETIEAQLAVP